VVAGMRSCVMKVSEQSGWRTGRSACPLVLAVLLAGAGRAPATNKTAAAANGRGAALAAEPARGALGASTTRFSPGVDEVLRLVDANASPEVIKAYVQDSRSAYHLSASEIVALKDRGVTSDVLVALLQHGRELRAQNPPVAPAAPVLGANPEAAPLVDPQAYAATPPPGADAYDYPAADYTYPYAYPSGYSYWWYNYSYPWLISYTLYAHRHVHNVPAYHSLGYPYTYRAGVAGVSSRVRGAPFSPAFGGRAGYAMRAGAGGSRAFAAPRGGSAGGSHAAAVRGRR
jgi:hypothetical protein